MRLVVAAALALPATAIAAPSTDDSGSRDRAESPTGVAALIAGYGVGLSAEPEDAAGPFNPVEAKVDYGTAINTFGGGGMRAHEGQDMFAPEGTPEISPEATEVLETGTDGGRGNWAALYEPRSQRTFVYMHMLGAGLGRGRPEAGGRRPGRPAGLHRLLRRRAPALRDPRGQGSLRRADRSPSRAAALGSVHRRLTRHTMAG